MHSQIHQGGTCSFAEEASGVDGSVPGPLSTKRITSHPYIVHAIPALDYL